MSSLIPSSAAERLIRNPHSLPRIPNVLANIISQNKHSDRIKHHAEQAYFLRRAKLENQRSERILAQAAASSSSSAIVDGTAATPSPPSSPLLPPSKPNSYTHRRNSDTVSSSLVLNSTNNSNNSNINSTPIRRRASSFTGVNSFSSSPPKSGRSLSFSHSRRLSSFDREPTLFSGVYFIPEEDELISLLYPHNSSSSSSPPHSLQHNMAFSSRIFSKNPSERLRQRCYFTKRPTPSWKSRNFEPIKQGKNWVSAHPGWHRIMRNEYKINGQEDTWREERNRFLQEFRRERQFQKQSQRRMSSHF